jgi:hypothetical protein
LRTRRVRKRPLLEGDARREGSLLPATRGLKGGQVMTTLDQFLVSNPNMAEKTYGDAMAASLSRAFPCQAQ